MNNNLTTNTELPSTKTTRRSGLKKLALGGVSAAVALLGNKAQAAPTGTRATSLTNLNVVAATTTTIRVSGRVTTMDGLPVAGLAVEVYGVGVAYFTRYAIFYTARDGSFNGVCPKPGFGAKIQIDIPGNGAYNRPLPTFSVR